MFKPLNRFKEILNCYEKLENLRKHNKFTTDKAYKRLFNLFNLKNDKDREAITSHVKSRGASKNKWYVAWVTLKNVVIVYKTMRMKKPSSVLLVGTDSSRLPGTDSIRQSLYRLTTPSVVNKKFLIRECLLHDFLILIDSWPLSPIKLCKPEDKNVIVLDYSSMFLIGAIYLILRPHLIAGFFLKYFLVSPKKLSIFILQCAFEYLDSKFKSGQGLLLSSNSLLLEILRFHCLLSDKYHYVVEVEHGILTVPTQKYYQGMNNISSDKHRLICQIPSCKSDIDKSYYLGKELFINPYLFQCLDKFDLEKCKNIDEIYYLFFHQIWPDKSLGSEKKKKNIVYFGSRTPNSISENYLLSDYFQFELRFLQKIVQIVSQDSIDIIYQPHPANKCNFNEISFFRENNVTICNDMIANLIFANGVVAILSSSLLEANYLGIKAFTPLIANDNFFIEDTFKFINNPINGSIEALDNALKNFRTSVLNSKSSFIERIRIFMSLSNFNIMENVHIHPMEGVSH